MKVTEVSFASTAAQRYADELGLLPQDFQDSKPSAKNGYTLHDVWKIGKALGLLEEQR